MRVYVQSEWAPRDPDDVICTECGNDLATEGYELCSECLEATS